MKNNTGTGTIKFKLSTLCKLHCYAEDFQANKAGLPNMGTDLIFSLALSKIYMQIHIHQHQSLLILGDIGYRPVQI